MKFLVLLSLVSFTALADIGLPGYNWSMTDISSLGLTKEALFTKMDRKFVKTNSSICSNRALMWAHDFKRDYNLDTGKIFLFYTKAEEELDENSPRKKTWWYHVAPIINERGELWVMDAGFGGFVKGPLLPREWIHKFSHSFGCKYIHSNETELVELIFKEQTFPKETSYGKNECYYKFVPHPFWTPDTVAKNILGRDRSGRPVHLERPEINQNELYTSCLEATTFALERLLGARKKECKEYAGIPLED